ncbi:MULTISPECIES: FAD/NAD(P)-binding protein [Rhizobium]|uniref:FAD/NAD(P)-binding protein n=1 Tax=Rhizobium TaxID=379 RepID=UPI001106A470|nr:MULTISPECIES: FAD/NAD(P)-binding protein [Rhizobium]MBX4935680.1 FAD-dependent pyridine nucleotide-disulfide oxidoreductase [Rhizobium bangladeshense]MBY3584687.1 FAD/NAD(P)-binding protein [Rhizobium bangladeshense]QSY92189.1 FAD/NAD(P)-binding protein [Rhizobium bangladeshense]TLX07040.1 FAD-dependent pyridine nucleotide-disulfide oxidoreductase [Rhizobium sp. MHM7A]
MIYDVVVVGSGFSAIAVTCNLIEQLPASATVAVVGDDPGFGRGTAYRTELYLHRLNVPAGRMSLMPHRPDDFVDWLKNRGRRLQSGDFASRSDYGLYVRDTLAQLLRRRDGRCRVDFIRAKAAGCVERYASTLSFHLGNGGEIAGKNVVLCLGVGNANLPVEPTGVPLPMRSRIIENPWRLSWLRRVASSDTVCILGSGLTMIDQVLALRAHGHRGRIDVLSRRGLAPLGHARRPPSPLPIDVASLPDTVSGILKSLREKSGLVDDWRSVMDGLRPVTQTLWQRLSDMERARFLRHALPWWNIHRHRVAPDVFDSFDKLVSEGTVRFHAGFLQSLGAEEGRLVAGYRVRATPEIAEIRPDWLVNCTGMERAGISHSPLLKEMRRFQLIAADPLGLGIQVDAASEVIAPSRISPARLFAVGALTAGQFWEITAVPDIRVQAKAVVEAIVAQRPAPEA